MHNMLEKNRFAIYSALLICLLVIIDGISGLLTPLDNRLLDSLVRHHAKDNTPDREIVVIDIDHDSLHQLNNFAGAWPWPRSVHASLIEALTKQNPKAIVFDIFFNTPDTERPEADQALNDLLSTLDNVFFPVYEKLDAAKNAGQLIQDLPSTLNFVKGKNVSPDAKASLLMPEAIPNELWKVGAINETIDKDGVERQYNIYRTFNGWRLPSLPTRLASYLGFTIPNQKEFILDWQQASTNIYPTLPYSQVLVNLTQQVDYPSKNYFADKIVIIGSTAIDQPASRQTPITELQPSAQVLATAIDNLKNHSFLSRPLGAFSNTSINLILLLALLVFVIKSKHHFLKNSLFMLGVSGFLFAISYMSVNYKTLVPIAGKLIWLWLFFITHFSWQLGRDALRRHRITKRFNDCVSDITKEQLIHDPFKNPELYNKKTVVTTLCCQWRQSSQLADSLDTAAFLTLANDYIDQQISQLFKQHATLHQISTTTITAFWGAPIATEKHAAVAISTALQLVSSMDLLKKKYQRPDLSLCIGIHTGLAAVGFFGPPQKCQYNAVGSTIEIAKSIAALNHNKSVVIVSSDTQQQCADDFAFIELNHRTLSDEENPVTLYEAKSK